MNFDRSADYLMRKFGVSHFLAAAGYDGRFFPFASSASLR